MHFCYSYIAHSIIVWPFLTRPHPVVRQTSVSGADVGASFFGAAFACDGDTLAIGFTGASESDVDTEVRVEGSNYSSSG
jgi:hypothetical protein